MNSSLSDFDRCDRCSGSASAKAVAEFETGELLLCGHHWRKHREAIIEQAKSYYVEPDHEDFNIQREMIEVGG